MELTEAYKVADAVDTDSYPPTNPAVLLGAAHSLYLSHDTGTHPRIRSIINWLQIVMEANDRRGPINS